MRTQLKLVAVVAFVVISIPAIWLGSAILYEKVNTYPHRFELHLDVDTPEGTRSAFSVIEVSITNKATWVPQSLALKARVKGEAVLVDLGNGKNIVGMLTFISTAQNHVRIDWIAPMAFNKKSDPSWFAHAAEWKGEPDVPIELTPDLVTFSNLEDPSTVKLIGPEKLEEVFGDGYRLRRVWIKMTDSPITNTIRNRMPWAGNYEAESIAVETLKRQTPLGLFFNGGYMFRRER